MGTWRRVATLGAALAMVGPVLGAEPRLLGPHGEDILALAFSPDGSILAICWSEAYTGRAVTLWDPAVGEKRRTIPGLEGDQLAAGWIRLRDRGGRRGDPMGRHVRRVDTHPRREVVRRMEPGWEEAPHQHRFRMGPLGC